MDLDHVVSKIEMFMFNNLILDDHIIVDDGSLNITMENYKNLRYTFIDDKDFGERTVIEQKKIIMLNDVMEIFTDLHQYIRENEETTPLYFDRNALKDKIEEQLSVNIDTIDEEICEKTTETTNTEIENIVNSITDMDI